MRGDVRQRDGRLEGAAGDAVGDAHPERVAEGRLARRLDDGERGCATPRARAAAGAEASRPNSR